MEGYVMTEDAIALCALMGSRITVININDGFGMPHIRTPKARILAALDDIISKETPALLNPEDLKD
jgi:hypothetical protein